MLSLTEFPCLLVHKPVCRAWPRAPSSSGHHHCPFGHARSVRAMLASIAGLENSAANWSASRGGWSRKSKGHRNSQSGTEKFPSRGVEASARIHRSSWPRDLFSGDLSPTSPLGGSGHQHVGPNLEASRTCIPSGIMQSSGMRCRLQSRCTESKCDGDPILPPYTSAEGRFVAGAGVAVTPSNGRMPAQASHCALYSRRGESRLVDQLTRACSNIVSLLSSVVSGNPSKSELRDSNRRQKARSSSRPSFCDFLPVRLSQALRASLSSVIWSWHAF